MVITAVLSDCSLLLMYRPTEDERPLLLPRKYKLNRSSRVEEANALAKRIGRCIAVTIRVCPRVKRLTFSRFRVNSQTSNPGLSV